MKKQLNKKYYSAESPVRHPFRMLSLFISDFKNIYFIGIKLLRRDIASQYRQTILGYLWVLIPPLATSLIWILLNSSGIVQITEKDIPYPIYVLTGTMFYQLFVDAINAPLKEFEVNRAMLTKIDFPKEALLISGIGQVVFSFIVKAVLLTVIIFIFRVNLKTTVFFLILPILGLSGIGILLGLLLVPIGGIYKDIQKGMFVFTTFLMYLTPVVYYIPERGIQSMIMRSNPLSYLLIITRDFLYTGSTEYVSIVCLIVGITYFLLLLSLIIYRLVMPILIERMDAQ
jgi:lipopolysaccharide transport system permease protein